MVTFLQSTVSVFYKYFITTSIYGMFERPPFPNHFILLFSREKGHFWLGILSPVHGAMALIP